MTDQPGQPGPEERLPAPRPEAPPAPVERFTSPPGSRKFELTPDRAAQIVRQSSNARWVSFLAVVIVVLFVALYWFYELGATAGRDRPHGWRRSEMRSRCCQSSAATTSTRPTARGVTA